ncbi:MAG: hypothetical protein R3A52_21860 [Polyangiales bacterium]
MLFIVGALAMGCGADASTGNTVVDAGNRTDTATGGGSDTGTSNPGTDAGTDAGTPTTDRGSTTPTDTGSTPTGGECGQGLTDAICACGMNNTCQQNAINGSSQTCQRCLAASQTTCCPTETQAIQMCAMTNMCGDQACVQTMCATQINALQTCFNMAQQNNTTCQDALADCFGTFPIQCAGP